MLRIHSFESMGTFDGPGLRLVVFMQGCNFKCAYCANPDTIPFTKGRNIEENEVVRRAISEKAFFGKKGGVTFSGGEPMLQAHVLIPIMRQLKENGIHICVDTNGSIMNEDVKEVYNLIDMVLLDVKQADNEKHRELTEQSCSQVWKTAKYLEGINMPVRLRCVMVPGFNDSDEDIRLLCEKYSTLTNIDRVEILPYHTYGVHKYETMGWPYKLAGVKEHTPEQVEHFTALFQEYFPNVWTQ
ncbi:MAG: pyruvate formate-lyase-activating protein [Porphyromonas sp.]|nr:pyruvate formate-lyase-activating protein [Porphyromonas sp.]